MIPNYQQEEPSSVPTEDSKMNILSIEHCIHVIDSLKAYNESLSSVVQDLLSEPSNLSTSAVNHYQTHLFDPDQTPCVGLDCEGSPDLAKQSGTLCIIQLSLINKKKQSPQILDIYLIDVFKIGGKVLATETNLRELLESHRVLKVIHDGRRDTDVLYYQMNGTRLNFTWDTQIADLCIRKSQLFHSIAKSNIKVASAIDSQFISSFVKWFGYLDALLSNNLPNFYSELIGFVISELEDVTNRSSKIDIQSELLEDCVRSLGNMLSNKAHMSKSIDKKDAHLSAKLCKDLSTRLSQSEFFQNRKENLVEILQSQVVEKALERFEASLSLENYKSFISRNHKQTEDVTSSLLPMSSQHISDLVIGNMFERTSYLNIIFIVNLYHFDIISKDVLKQRVVSVLLEKFAEGNNLLPSERNYILVALNYIVYAIEYRTYSSSRRLTEGATESLGIIENVERLIERIEKCSTPQSPSSPYLIAAKGENMSDVTLPIQISTNFLPLDIRHKNGCWCIMKGFEKKESKELSPSFILTPHQPVSNAFKIKSLVRLLSDFCMIDYTSKYIIQEKVGEQENYWKERPLTQHQMEGAAMDVNHLLFLYETQRFSVNNKRFKPGNGNSSLASTIIRRSHLYDRTLRDFEFPVITQSIRKEIEEKGIMDEGYFYLDVSMDDWVKSKSDNPNKQQYLRVYFFTKSSRDRTPYCDFDFEADNEIHHIKSLDETEQSCITSKFYLGKLIGSKGKNISELHNKFPATEMYAGEQTFTIIGSLDDISKIGDMLFRDKELKLPLSQAGRVANKATAIRCGSKCDFVRMIPAEKDATEGIIQLGGSKIALADAERRIHDLLNDKKRK